MGSTDRKLARAWVSGLPAGEALARELGDPREEPERFLSAVFALRPDVWLRRMPGRETFAHGAAVVVKRFRGDAWAERWRAWLSGAELRSPARREAENLAALRELGLPVPAPLFWCEESLAADGAARSALAMERLPHALHLRRLLSRSTALEARAWTLPLARLVARLHREHWFHRDLYLQHFAVLDAGERRLALLDCGRARKQVPVASRWIVKDLAQLFHSCPEHVAAPARWRFLVLYARERAPARELDLRALARRIVAKDARMRAHAPRHLDPSTAHPDGSER